MHRLPTSSSSSSRLLLVEGVVHHPFLKSKVPPYLRLMCPVIYCTSHSDPTAGPTNVLDPSAGWTWSVLLMSISVRRHSHAFRALFVVRPGGVLTCFMRKIDSPPAWSEVNSRLRFSAIQFRSRPLLSDTTRCWASRDMSIPFIP
jgi:hypothetical protein